MQREIKFRGKRVDNLEWVYGNLTDNLLGEPLIEYRVDHRGILKIRGQEREKVIPESIGQYTGQKCGDMEWYEGDIIRINENDPEDVGIYVCTWIQEWCMFALLNVEMGEYAKYLTEGADSLDTALYWTYPIDTDKTEDGKYEVIGNIHDNPELLSK